MGIMDDKGIIELYFARDENAISETMKSYNGRLLRFAMHFLSDKRDAEECVNDTYVRAWDTIPPNRPVTWILMNCLIFLFR